MLGRALADRFDGKNDHLAVVLRQLAHYAASPTEAEPAAGCCPGCGDTVVQSGVGRPRRWCSARCRNREAKRKRNDVMGS